MPCLDVEFFEDLLEELLVDVLEFIDNLLELEEDARFLVSIGGNVKVALDTLTCL